jgi:DNA repair exonuclease SbcCD ATPase subunit
MTKRQANLISEMCENAFDIKRFDKAHAELLQSCSDTEPCPVPTPQPTVTISATSTAKPLGQEWWKERQAEAAQEQMEIIKAQAQKIQSLQKQIAEDMEHWDKQAVIDKGYREHNDELVAANVEIYQALGHWGLEQLEPCSLVDNVKHVIQLCAERGKAHFEQKDTIERLNDQIDSQSKVIEELTEQRDQWEELAAKRSGEMNRRSDMIDMMEKQCDRKDNAIKALKATCDIRQGFIDKGLELSDKLRKLLMEKINEIDGLQKRIKRMEEAGDRMVNEGWNEPHLAEAWRKAKEDKL